MPNFNLLLLVCRDTFIAMVEASVGNVNHLSKSESLDYSLVYVTKAVFSFYISLLHIPLYGNFLHLSQAFL